MEKINTYYVNFDYDINFLSKRVDYNFKNQKIIEFIFFIINEEPNAILASRFKYNESYLSYLSSLGFKICKTTQNFTTSNFWWGNFDHFEMKKSFISKSNLIKTLENTGLIPEFVRVISKGEKISVSEGDKKFFYRQEYGYSGLGNRIVENGFVCEMDGTIAPLLKVVITFGVTINLEDESFFICQNRINEKGNFLGGRIIKCEAIAKLLNKTSLEIEKEIQDIISIFKRKGAVSYIQFDSLIYENNSMNCWYKVVEVNYRKTMGLFVKKLYEKFGEGEFFFTKDVIKNAIELSPPENKMKCFYLKDENSISDTV